MSTLATLVIKLTGDVAGFAKSMSDAESRVSSVASSMTRAGTVATAGITVPLLAAGAAAIHFGQDLDAAMANVESLGVARERVVELKTAVQDMAIATGKHTTDLAQGLYQVVSAFGDTADSAEILRINAMAAGAGLSTTTEAINLTSAVTKGYGDTTAEAVQRVADLALRTVQLGQTTFPELAASMGRVVPIAASLNVSQQELFTTMATLTGVTGTASEVGTQLRGTLQSMMAPTESMAGLIETLGFKSGAAMMQELGLHGSILAIVQAAEASGTPLQSYIGSIEGQTLALALAGPQADTYQAKLLQMGQAAGTTQSAFEAQTNGINANGFAMEQAKIKMEVFLQRIYDGLAPALSRAIEAAQPLVDAVMGLSQRFAELDPKTQTVIVAIVGLVAAIGPLLAILGLMLPALAAVGGALAAVTAPVWLVVAAVAALGLAWATNFGGIRDTVMGWWASIQPALTEAATLLRETLMAAIERLRVGFGEMMASLAPVREKFAEMTAAGGNLLSALAPVAALIGGVLVEAFRLLVSIVASVMPQVGSIVSGVVEAITSLLTGLAGIVRGLVDLVVAVFKGDWAGAWAAAQDVVFEMVDGIIGVVTGLGKAVVALVGGLVDGVVKWFKDLYHTLVGGSIVPDLVAAILAAFGSLPGKVVAFVAALVNQVVDKFNELKSQALSAVTGLAAAVVGKFNDLKSQALSAAASMASAVIGKFNDLKSTAISHASALASTVISRFNELKGTAISHASALANTVGARLAEMKSTAISHASALASTVVSRFNDLRSQATGAITQMVSSIMGWLMSLRDQALALVGALVASIVSAFNVDWAGVGSGIVNGVIGGVRAAAGALAAAAIQVVRDALAAARAALGIHSPSTVAAQEIGEPITQGIGQGILDGMAWLVDAISTVAQGVETAGVEEFSGAAQSVAEAVGPALEALAALAGWDMDADGLEAKMAALAGHVEALVGYVRLAADRLGGEGMAAARAFGEAAGPVIDIVVGGVEALVALGGLAQVDGNLIDERMAAFADIMGGLTQHMRRAAGYFTQEMLDAAAAFGNAVGPITEPIEQGVGALVALSGLAQVDGSRIDGRMSAFADIMGGLTQHMRRVAGYFTQEMLDAAAAFGAAIGPITEPIEQGVGALVALGELAEVDGGRIDKRMSAFADMMGGLTQHMKRVAGYFTEEMLAAAVAFGNAIGPITEPIEQGVAALKALSEASATNSSDLLAKAMAFAGNMSLLAQALANASGTISSEAVEAAERFATAVGNVVDPIGGGVAALKTLSEASATNSWDLLAKMIAFAGNMSMLAQVLANASGTISDQALEAAERFAAFVDDAKEIIESVVDASEAMTKEGMAASAQFKWSTEKTAENIIIGMMHAAGLEGGAYGIPQVMERMTSAVVGAMWVISSTWRNIEYAGYQFGQNWVGLIMAGIQSRLGDLRALLDYIRGLFPSSPAKYGAWQDLPDGKGVGAAFVGGLAGGLGAGPVAGALGGLRELFGGMGGAGGLAGMGGEGQSITITVNNPVGEPTERSITRQMRNLAALGLVG